MHSQDAGWGTEQSFVIYLRTACFTSCGSKNTLTMYITHLGPKAYHTYGMLRSYNLP